MRSYFIWNGINSIDKNIMIKKIPVLTKPSLRTEEIIIPGRSGKLYQDTGDIYETSVIQLECVILDNTDIREITSWLKGESKLILSNDQHRFYNAKIINQIDFTNIANQLHEFPLQIEIQPYSYSLKEYVLELKKATNITVTKSNSKIKPKITIYGTGNITITINNKSQILKSVESFIVLDSEIEEAYKDNVSKNSLINGEFLNLYPNIENKISWTGSVQKVLLEYRETYV